MLRCIFEPFVCSPKKMEKHAFGFFKQHSAVPQELLEGSYLLSLFEISPSKRLPVEDQQ